MDHQLPKLTGKQARFLRSVGHSLKPILQVGKFGITDNFIKQVNSALDTHELIKVKVGKNSETELKKAVDILLSQIPCQLAQSIGKTLLLYKPKDDNPKAEIPAIFTNRRLLILF